MGEQFNLNNKPLERGASFSPQERPYIPQDRLIQGQAFRFYEETFLANETKEFNIPGNAFAVLKSGGLLTFSFNEEKGIPVESRFGFNVSQYNKVSVTSDVNQTVQIVLGYFNAVGLNGNPPPPNSYDSVPDVSVPANSSVLIYTGAGNINAVVVHNSTANSSSFRVGSSLVTATRGYELEPGASISFDCTDSLYAFNTDLLAAQDISVTAELTI